MNWPGREKVCVGGGGAEGEFQDRENSRARPRGIASQEGREEEEAASTCLAPLFG